MAARDHDRTGWELLDVSGCGSGGGGRSSRCSRGRGARADGRLSGGRRIDRGRGKDRLRDHHRLRCFLRGGHIAGEQQNPPAQSHPLALRRNRRALRHQSRARHDAPSRQRAGQRLLRDPDRGGRADADPARARRDPGDSFAGIGRSLGRSGSSCTSGSCPDGSRAVLGWRATDRRCLGSLGDGDETGRIRAERRVGHDQWNAGHRGGRRPCYPSGIDAVGSGRSGRGHDAGRPARHRRCVRPTDPCGPPACRSGRGSGEPAPSPCRQQAPGIAPQLRQGPGCLLNPLHASGPWRRSRRAGLCPVEVRGRDQCRYGQSAHFRRRGGCDLGRQFSRSAGGPGLRCWRHHGGHAGLDQRTQNRASGQSAALRPACLSGGGRRAQ